MPIYEYECGKCKQRFEYLVRSASEDIKCEACGSRKLTKLISTFAFNSSNISEASSSSSRCSGCSSGNCSGCSR